MLQYAPGCILPGEPKVELRLKNRITAQAEDKSWGELRAFALFEDDSKEEAFKLYKSQVADKYGNTKIDDDAIATVSRLVSTT
jgi:hypothetical protein